MERENYQLLVGCVVFAEQAFCCAGFLLTLVFYWRCHLFGASAFCGSRGVFLLLRVFSCAAKKLLNTLPKPPRMMLPGPPEGNGSTHHRADGPFDPNGGINMHDNPDDQNKRGNRMHNRREANHVNREKNEKYRRHITIPLASNSTRQATITKNSSFCPAL
jgi:hypothetical protein